MRVFSFVVVLAVALILAEASPATAGFITLTFDAPVPGTLADRNGLGTGFTDRLPGTGHALPTNDTNMDLLSSPGRLLLTSTHADINQHPGPTGSNLGHLEAPGLFLPNLGLHDFSISGLFRDVRVPNASDQLFLYVGTSETNVVRAGFHELDVYMIVENQGSGDQRPFLSAFDAFMPGDDVMLTFGRTSGVWRQSWENLTNPSASGFSPGFSIPWLDGEKDLYVGVLAANAGSDTSFTAKLDTFDVARVPEPATLTLLGTGLIGVFVFSCRRLRQAGRLLTAANQGA